MAKVTTKGAEKRFQEMNQRGLGGLLFVVGLILPLCHPVDCGCIPAGEKLQYKRAPFIKMNIVEFPNDVVLPLGYNITLVCISNISLVDGVPREYLQTYWVPMYFYDYRIKSCGGSEADREDSKTCELHIVNATKKDSGNYSCQAHSETSCTEVTQILIFEEPSPPRFTVHPRQKLNITKGQSGNLSCEATGVPRPKITWFKDHLPLSKTSVKETKGFSMLTFNAIGPSDQGRYWCEARSSEGENRSLATNLTVLWKPMFSVHPANISVHENANVTLSCEADGSPPAVIDWWKNKKLVTNARLVQNGSFSSLILHFVQAKEAAGKYACVATNPQGTTVSWEGTLKVLLNDPGSLESGPSFYQHPEGIRTSRGSTVKFTCSARGLPLPIITWMKDGEVISDLNAESSQSNDTSTLSIWNVEERHRGSYWCVASSSGLNVTSSKATLSLKESSGDNHVLWITLGAALSVALSLLIVLVYFKQKRWSSASLKLKKELVYILEKKERFVKENTNEDIITQLRGQMRDEQFTEDGDEATDHETYLKLMGIDRNWEIPREKLTILEVKLGGGEFGIVNKGIYLRTNGSEMPVAVKLLKDNDNQTERQDLVRELETLIHVGRHPNIVSLVGACTFEDPICVVIEFVPGGSLDKLLRSSRVESEKNDPVYANIWSRLTERELLQMAADVANGMKHLESKQCVHRDLAARNVLIAEGLVAKVADFGMARDISTNGAYIKTTEGRIPWLWMSMEALRGIFTTKADVWSFGVLLWEIVTLGELPHRGVKGVVELHNKLQEGYRLQKPAHCSDELYNIMLDCWKTAANDRPSFQELRCKLREALLAKERSYINVTFFEEQQVCETKEEAV